MAAKRIVVGMSGGVDSSVSLLLLKQQGWSPVGVSLKLAHWEHPSNCLGANACCTAESLAIARRVCGKLGVEHHVHDVSAEFERVVMDYFIAELKQGRTPNPCVICNRRLKFESLLRWGQERGITHVATGHYARVWLNNATGKYELLRGKDTAKDQTYGLSFLSQKQLKHAVFPLGELTKDEVYRIAQDNGLDIFLKRKESQDLCFVSSQAYPLFLKEHLGVNPGPILDEQGNALGKHKGLHFYTVSQRKGLGLNEKYFVKRLDTEKNALIVIRDRKDARQNEVVMREFSFISGKAPQEEKRVSAKIRYRHRAAQATLYPPENGELRIVFDSPQEFVTPGQFCVFYDTEVCLGAGIIY